MKHQLKINKLKSNSKVVQRPTNSKLSLWHSKKGFNDMYIMGGIIAMFILLGAFLPFVHEAFNSEQVIINDGQNIVDDVGQDPIITSINAITIIGSIAKIFFWTFGDLPFFIDIFLWIPRIILYLTLARNIWIGGGS